MKPQLVEVREPPSVGSCSGAQLLSLSLQQELSAAIHAAFEVAVEIVVREVTELVSQATGSIYEQTRQESESLKQRLQRAEARLEAAPTEERIVGSPHAHPPDQLACSRGTDTYAGGKGDAAGHSRVDRPPSESRGGHMSSGSHREEEQLVQASERQQTDGCADIPEEISHVRVVKVESLNQQCRDQRTQQSLLPPHSDEMFVTDHVIPKQESLDEERDDSSCYLDSVKVEDFSPDCMSAVQAAMLEEWNPQEQDFHQQDQDCQLACTQLANGISPNLELPCLSEFPNQLCEEASIPKASPQVYGVHVRTSRGICHNPAPPYACKSCGQTFQLPSMLRRHYNHCQQRLQQPQTGSKRTKLQLYPPGCSPFRCTECNREFNRMENLKTHLRIHTGERPYTCSVCSKCFRHSGALTRHFRIHTGEKPYVCGQCGKSFRNCGGLKFHQRSHSK